MICELIWFYFAQFETNFKNSLTKAIVSANISMHQRSAKHTVPHHFLLKMYQKQQIEGSRGFWLIL